MGLSYNATINVQAAQFRLMLRTAETELMFRCFNDLGVCYAWLGGRDATDT